MADSLALVAVKRRWEVISDEVENFFDDDTAAVATGDKVEIAFEDALS